MRPTHLTPQATIGGQSSVSHQDSLTGHNEASQINAGNAIFNIQGAGKDSDLVVTGSDITLKGDRYNNVEGDVIEQAAVANGYERSSNKSTGFGIGAYASTQGGAGITANANMSKGHGNGETTTNTNSHITVAGTTYQNVGGDYILDGAVEKGDHMTGHIGGGIKATSRQDTATYEGKQTNIGVSLDIDLKGDGSSASLNVGRNKVNADYAAVTEQTGLQYQSSDVVVDGKSAFKGAYFTTATPEDNKTQFNGGLEVSDIQNHSNYKADGINIGVSAGLNPLTGVVRKPGIGGIGYGRDGDSDTSTTYGAVTGLAGKSEVTTGTVGDLNAVLQNNFDKDRVNAQIDAQVQVSQAFDTERRVVRSELQKKEEELRKEVEEARKNKDIEGGILKLQQAEKIQNQILLLDTITGAIYGPNTNGITGYMARAVAPTLSNQIGEYFKNHTDLATGKLSAGQQASHLLAHGILGAAVSYATGNSAVSGGVSAVVGEGAAPLIANYLYGTMDTTKLTTEQKNTISSITSLAGLAVGGSTGNVTNAINASETARVAVDDNWGEVGHFSTVAAVMYLGGFPPNIAKAIAYAAWAPDTDSRNAATIPNVTLKNGIQTNIHLLDGLTDKEEIRQQRIAIEESLKPYLTEIYEHPERANSILQRVNVQNLLHMYGDSFAHVKTDGTHYRKGFGHTHIRVEDFTLKDGSEVDDPLEHPDAYLLYINGLTNLVSSATNNHISENKVNGLISVNAQIGEEAQIERLNSIVNQKFDTKTTVQECKITQICINLGQGSKVKNPINKLTK